VNEPRVPDWVVGAWERTSLVLAGEPVAGIGRAVWIQTERSYVDVRAPGSVASGTAFAGPGAWHAGIFTWHHEIDLYPGGGPTDCGTLELDGDDLVECGDDLEGHGPYVERWHRIPGSGGRAETITAIGGLAVLAGDHYAFARDERDRGGQFAARYRRRARDAWVDEIAIGAPDWQPF
jgi:hypothetical protein